MKKALLIALLVAPTYCFAQTNGEDFVGVWKIKARCVEVGCEAPRADEPKQGALSAQTWTISQINANEYVLTSDNKSIGTIKGGRFNGESLEFLTTGYGVKATNHIVIKLDNNKISATRLVGRQAADGVCMVRFTVAGVQ